MKLNSLYKIVFFACTLVLLCVSCSKEAVIDLFNNQSAEVEVLFENRTVLMHSKSMLSLAYGSVAKGLTIKNADGQFRYQLPKLDRASTRALWKHQRSKDVLTIQLEPDGLFYLVYPSSTVPVSSFLVQPDGFPLRPQFGK